MTHFKPTMPAENRQYYLSISNESLSETNDMHKTSQGVLANTEKNPLLNQKLKQILLHLSPRMA